MNNYTIMNILDLMESLGEDEIKKGLLGFSCPPNQDIEEFVHRNAVEFAKRKQITIKFLVSGILILIASVICRCSVSSDKDSSRQRLFHIK